MANINEIELKIKAVEFALGSFADYDNEQGRKSFLKKNLTAIPGLRTYFGFSEDKLQDALNKLQDEKNLLLEKEKKLQEETNLLLEKEKKLQEETNLLLEKEILISRRGWLSHLGTGGRSGRRGDPSNTWIWVSPSHRGDTTHGADAPGGHL
jgi:hypothetical protein